MRPLPPLEHTRVQNFNLLQKSANFGGVRTGLYWAVNIEEGPRVNQPVPERCLRQ